MSEDPEGNLAPQEDVYAGSSGRMGANRAEVEVQVHFFFQTGSGCEKRDRSNHLRNESALQIFPTVS